MHNGITWYRLAGHDSVAEGRERGKRKEGRGKREEERRKGKERRMCRIVLVSAYIERYTMVLH